MTNIRTDFSPAEWLAIRISLSDRIDTLLKNRAQALSADMPGCGEVFEHHLYAAGLAFHRLENPHAVSI